MPEFHVANLKTDDGRVEFDITMDGQVVAHGDEHDPAALFPWSDPKAKQAFQEMLRGTSVYRQCMIDLVSDRQAVMWAEERWLEDEAYLARSREG